jgi:hypothetical protein
MSKTTILVESTTREHLKQLGIKGQTYDELITQLIELKRKQDSFGYRASNPQPSESRSP